MLIPFLVFTAISITLVKLGALIIWVKVLTSIVQLALLVIGLLTLTLFWQSWRRRR